MRLLLLAITIATLTPLSAFSTELPGGVADGDTLRADESPYSLTGDLLVLGLFVEPGVVVEAAGNYEIHVVGLLVAVGTQTDSISFTAADTVAGWQGMFFDQSFPATEIAFCRIARSLNSGIRINNASPTVRNCLVTDNSARIGAGLRISGSLEVMLTRCVIEGNGYQGDAPRGGGIYTTAPLALDHCEIVNNTIDDFRVGDCFGTGDASALGGGIYAEGDLTLQNVVVAGNVANSRGGHENSRGGGVYLSGTLTAHNSVVLQNVASAGGCNVGGGAVGYGGGIYLAGSASMGNCIVSECNTRTSGGGVYVSGSATLENCTIVYCGPPSTGGAGGLAATGGSSVELRNCIVYFNLPSQLSGPTVATFSDVEGGWPGEGNISQHPLIVLNPEEPCHLAIRSGSPCVDGGDPSPAFNDLCFPPSCGTSRNDMGAHGGPGGCEWPSDECDVITAIADGRQSAAIPATPVMGLLCAPNPSRFGFDIGYTLQRSSYVRGEVLDVTGRLVRLIEDSTKDGGPHSVRWDGRDEHGRYAARGVYFVRVTGAGGMGTARVVLLR